MGIEELKKEIQSLRIQRQKSNQEVIEVNEKLDRLRTERDSDKELWKADEKRDSRLGEMEKLMGEKNKAIDARNKKISKLEEQLERLEKEGEEHKRRNSELTKIVDDVKAENQRTQHKLDNAERKVEGMSTKQAANNTSWFGAGAFGGVMLFLGGAIVMMYGQKKSGKK